MNLQVNRRLPRFVFGLFLLMTFLCIIPALVFSQSSGIRVAEKSHNSITLTWERVPGVSSYRVSYQANHTNGEETAGTISGSTFTLRKLKPRTTYTIWVTYSGGFYQISATTSVKIKPTTVPTPSPAQHTCPFLPSSVAISGHSVITQCQMIDEAGVGRMDLIKRGVIEAVDLWYYVPERVEVCLKGDGWLVFLDANIMPRVVMELEHYQRDGMTCGIIDGEGQVVLLASPPADAPSEQHVEQPVVQPAEETSTATLPVFEPIPLVDCQIKLVETLFLRAEPAGQIIDIVWLNSEIPAFEINGYWYKVEFEGKVGYISRYHRKVLRGGCG